MPSPFQYRCLNQALGSFRLFSMIRVNAPIADANGFQSRNRSAKQECRFAAKPQSPQRRATPTGADVPLRGIQLRDCTQATHPTISRKAMPLPESRTCRRFLDSGLGNRRQRWAPRRTERVKRGTTGVSPSPTQKTAPHTGRRSMRIGFARSPRPASPSASCQTAPWCLRRRARGRRCSTWARRARRRS